MTPTFHGTAPRAGGQPLSAKLLFCTKSALSSQRTARITTAFSRMRAVETNRKRDAGTCVLHLANLLVFADYASSHRVYFVRDVFVAEKFFRITH